MIRKKKKRSRKNTNKTSEIFSEKKSVKNRVTLILKKYNKFTRKSLKETEESSNRLYKYENKIVKINSVTFFYKLIIDKIRDLINYIL